MAFNDKDKVDLKKKFLTEFGKTRTISSAVSGLPVGRNSIYEWFKEDSEFKQKFDDARLAVGESLESTAFTLIDRMLQSGDYSRPLLLITMLNAHLPERYRANDNTGDDSRQLISEFRKMAKTKKPKPKVVKEAEDIINDSDPK
tara:strand:+ start:136 stop:567 length:432 start_codon:yes stop_codon:yes gene_type:complete|eukprot:GHVR01017892.1.p1 GENE.GHVR01017892.1~~GHVR01017892.1.p1  ORF type:complete len:144 (-),score=23.05 GHVR01017892.1:158-589(-)